MSDVRYVELHGCRVAYREAGSGEVVLLIQGMAGRCSGEPADKHP